MEPRARTQSQFQSAQAHMFGQPGQQHVSLTAEGFSFILKDESTQVHDILWNYIRRANLQF